MRLRTFLLLTAAALWTLHAVRTGSPFAWVAAVSFTTAGLLTLGGGRR